MKYPTHEEIAGRISAIADAHINFTAMHNRENLDDLIADLLKFRDTLPSVEEYIKLNQL
jgi:hypothetical protein